MAEAISVETRVATFVIHYDDGSIATVPRDPTPLEVKAAWLEEQGDLATAKQYRTWAANIHKYGTPELIGKLWVKPVAIAAGVLAASVLLAWLIKRR